MIGERTRERPARCPCGTALPPVTWRRRSKSHLYCLKCPVCGRRGSPATTDFAQLTPIWNDSIRNARERDE